MKFKTHNDLKNNEKIDVNGTSLMGEINIGYRQLVKIFGEPSKGDGYKVDAVWDIQFKDGTVATVYNYKDGRNYNGDEGMATNKIRDWHIGGFNRAAFNRVTEVVNKKLKKQLRVHR